MNTHSSPQDSTDKDAPVDPAADPSGHTTPAQQSDSAPRMPHERDESSDSQVNSSQTDVMRQAKTDLDRGLVDTDRAPVTDALYESKVRPDGEATEHRGASKS